jgi:conserved hypothetical protein, proteobacterial
MTNTFRALLAATAFAGAFAAAPAFADEAPASDITVTGNVALVSDYRFRGLSLSNGDPAIQGGITVTHSSGLYVGTWASSITDVFGYAGNTGNTEVDLFAGYSREVTPGLTADVGLLYYAYPGGHFGKAEFFEPYASLSTTYGPAKVKVGVNYAWKQDATNNDDNIYVYSNVDVAIPSTPLTVSGHVGYTDGPLALPYFTTTYKTHGWDYSAGVSATVLGKVTVGVSYVGVEGPVINRYSDDQVVGTLSVAF